MTLGERQLQEIVERLPRETLASERWFGGKERRIEGVSLVDALVLDEARALLVCEVVYAEGTPERYVLDPLGERFWGALLSELADGSPRAGLRGSFELRLTGRLPSPGERLLGVDQSNTSHVLGEALVLKCYRRLLPGIHPEIELVARLTDHASSHVPPGAGSLHWISPEGHDHGVALLQAYVPGARDGWAFAEELLAEAIETGGAPEALEHATAFASALGSVTADLQAALMSLGTRPAGASDLRAWRGEAEEQLLRVLELAQGEVAEELRAAMRRIRSELACLEDPETPPLLSRVHGDYHVGQILRSPAGFHVIDFEGEPTKTLEERRAHGSPLRDAAAMIRSFDHLARWAVRETPEAAPIAVRWSENCRRRFLTAYEEGIVASGSRLVLDRRLLRAFEVEKEVYELGYAAAFLPTWLFVARGAMRDLLA